MKKTFKTIIIVCILILLATSFLYTYGALHPLSLNNQSQIMIYDRYGTLMYQSNNKQQSTYIPLKKIPKTIQDVVLLVEDQHFYKHAGFDPFRIFKAFFTNIKNQSIVEGGSSISQQYVKNLFLEQDQLLSRKLKEFFYTLRLEMQYDKQTILEGYLNTIYFGHGIYGISDASEYYFQLPLDQLNLKQICCLIAIPNGPSIYSPLISLENNENRTNLLLNILLKHQYLNEKQYEESKNLPLNLNPKPQEIINQYYVDAVLNELSQLSIDHSKPLSIYTNYDPYLQQALQHSVDANLAIDHPLQCASIISDSYQSKVYAIIGGKDYTLSQYHRALYGNRQIASTIKPLLYYCALNNGFSPTSKFVSCKTQFHLEDEIYEPHNYMNIYPNKEITMINALALSDNIYAVKTHLFLGKDVLCDALKSFNIDALPIASLALGSVNMSLMQLHQIYNTFASEGNYNSLSFIDHIYQEGHMIYQHQNENKALLNRDEVLILNQMMTAVFDEKNSDYALPTMLGYEGDMTMAAKSGSSDWDSYVLAFNPKYVISIWCGYDDHSLLKSEDYTYSKKIYKALVDQIMIGQENIWYERSNQLKKVTIDPKNGESNDLGSEYWIKK